MSAVDEFEEIIKKAHKLSRDQQLEFFFMSLGSMKVTLGKSTISKKEVVNAYRIVMEVLEDNG